MIGGDGVYLVFGGQEYYATGGAYDLLYTSNDKNDALDKASEQWKLTPPHKDTQGEYKQRYHPTQNDLNDLQQHAQLSYDRRTQDDTYANDGGSWIGLIED